MTARIKSGVVVVIERLENPARMLRLPTGERSPASHGEKSTPRAPGGEVAASVVISSKVIDSPEPARTPRNHSRAFAPVSWELIIKYPSLLRPGTVAMECFTSVFIAGRGQLIHEVVESARCMSKRPVAPAPSAAACRSGIPVVTSASLARPSSSATLAVTGPTTEPKGTNGGRNF